MSVLEPYCCGEPCNEIVWLGHNGDQGALLECGVRLVCPVCGRDMRPTFRRAGRGSALPYPAHRTQRSYKPKRHRQALTRTREAWGLSQRQERGGGAWRELQKN